jgi:plasmid stability protein
MTSYSGLTEQVLIKMDPGLKSLLAQRALAEQTSLSAEARKAMRAGLAALEKQEEVRRGND